MNIMNENIFISVLFYSGGGLSDDVDYIFTLTATSGSKAGSVSRTFIACSVPSFGSCSVSPTTLIPLTDQVTVSCQDWKDTSSPSAVFHYKVVIQNFDEVSEEYTAYDGTSAEIKTYVSPWPRSTKVFVFVYVLNEFRSEIKAAAV